MKTATSLVMVFAASLFACNVACADEPTWIHDFEIARGKAQAENCSLFILFTGHGWCHACKLLDREVFSTRQFVDATRHKYVFVELDFTFDNEATDVLKKSKMMQLKDRFLAPGVPTVVLADSDGRPYAYVTGYDSGTGPKRYLEELEAAELAKKKRDEFMHAAQSATGELRVENLDRALDAVVPMLGNFDERGDDPLLMFYGDKIREILAQTDRDSHITEKYTVRKKERDDFFEAESVFKRLDEFDTSENYVGAISYIENQLESNTNKSMRWRLEFAKQVYLEWSDRNSEALDNCRRLLASESLSSTQRESLLDREAFNLFQLGRRDDALAHYDNRIAGAADDREKRLRLLRWKSSMIFGKDPVVDSIAALEAYRNEAGYGTEDWLRATTLSAREFKRAEDYSTAVQLMEESLKVDRNVWILLDAAESCLMLMDFGKCDSYLEEATRMNNSLDESPRPSNREKSAKVSGRIKELKQKLAKALNQSAAIRP